MAAFRIETRQLRYFVAVAEQLSFRSAAIRLHISQPPLTRQIQQLEEELGVALFARNSRGVELTAAGSAFLEEATNLLTLLERAGQRTSMVGHGLLGRLDIGVFGSSTLGVVPRLVLGFRSSHPNVEVALHNLGKAEQVKALKERRITVGFNRLVDPDPDIVVESVLTEGLHVVFRRGQAPARRKVLKVSDLRGQPLILFPRTPRPSFADRVIWLCRQQGFEPVVVQEVDDVVTAMALVSGGFGITVAPDGARNLRLPGIAFAPLERARDTVVDLCCLYRKGDDSAVLAAFLKAARSYRG
jgi:LysR family transcriptional regulator, benzoate and cis,cis-muconate-responsive activator of ben and cat genes